MSEENDLPEPTESKGSEPKRKFSQEHYDRLMKGQEPWREFRRSWEGEGIPWEAFEEDSPDAAAVIRAAVEAWNANPPRPALLEGAQIYYANLKGANLHGAHLEGADLHGAHLEGADLGWAHLKGADLDEAHLEEADLYATHLEGARLNEANLTGASFGYTAISGGTHLSGIKLGPDHNAMHDDSDLIQLPRDERWLNWGVLRTVGALPLFEVSYVALAASLITINSIGYLNRTELSQWLEYPIPTPARMTWLFWSSLLLVVGTTIYKLRCPRRVQVFSETEWVEQHGHPRLQYLAESLRRRRAQVLSSGFTVVGGAIGLALLVDRVVATFQYLYP